MHEDAETTGRPSVPRPSSILTSIHCHEMENLVLSKKKKKIRHILYTYFNDSVPDKAWT